MSGRTMPTPRKRLEMRRFLGVDFSAEATEVDIRRSPDAVNVWIDRHGCPEKRPGYCRVETFDGKRINSIGFLGETRLVHAGSTLYADGQPVAEGLLDARSAHFVSGGKYYLLDGQDYLVYDGENAGSVEGYIPTTVIGRQPTGGGTFLEAVNLLQPRRVNCFCADGQSREFLLDADGIDDAPVEVTVQGRTLGEGEYAVDRDRGKVTFVTPPPDSQGLDSVAISFAKTEEGYRERIGKCRWAGRYGLGSDTRIFLSGNPDMPDTDWQSGLYDPTYFPDTGYTCIGKEDSAIMGYAKKYDAMIVVKEDGLFLRTAELTQYSDGQNERTALIFPVKEGVSGVGAIAPYAFGDLLDDPLFLSENGVVGMDTNAVTNQRTVVRRSGKVDARLRREKDLKEAVAAVWKDSYVLCTGGRAYVANGRATYGQIGGSFAYEWSYWENIPARVLEEKDGQLYFGTEDGAVMRFMDPEREGMAAYTDDGKTIYAKWTSPILDGGDMTRYKTVYPKGTGVLLKPQSRSSARLFLLTDRGERLEKQSIPMDIFSFDDVDFGRFTFFTTDAPRMQLLGGTHKRVLRFCLGVENDKANEGFGLCAMTVCLSTGGRMRKNYG